MRAVTVAGAVCLFAALTLGCASTPLTPEQIVPAFIAASQADTRTMHMEWQGTMNQLSGGDQGSGLGQISQAINGTFDFNGPDFAGDISTSVAGIGPSNQVSYARVAGASFVNYANSGWQSSDAFGQPAPNFDPLHGLTAAAVVYEAAETVGGRAVHRLRVNDPLASLAGGLFGQADPTGATLELNGPSTYVLYVDERGIPVSAHVDLSVAMTANVDAAVSNLAYAMVFDYTFSLWGEPVTISPPQLSGNGGGIKDGPPPPVTQPNF